MLRALRLRLTLLYLGVGLTFLVLVGVGSYALLRGYYREITDLALQHRLVQELGAIGAPVPAPLAAGDRAWYASHGRPEPPRRLPATPLAAGGQQASDSGDEGDGHEGGEEAGAETPERSEEQFEEAYDGELAAIYLLGLTPNGRPLAAGNLPGAAPTANAEAVAGAAGHGIDWRTVPARDGSPVRLLTYALPGGTGAPVLQLGRPLADQERVLNRLLAVLLSLGVLSAVLLGVGSWWVAGRSLRPTEAAWRQQQAFVANASHELRTPLTLIRASAEVLARGLPRSGDQWALIGDIVAETDHMSQLVSDLLLLSRLDSGQVQIQREPIALEVVVADLARQFGRLAEAKGVAFTAQGPPEAVLADPTRLRQVLLALLDNALRHTPAGGQIALTAGLEGATAVITVADTGTGIPPEHLPRVFDRFYRAESSGGEAGAGLGLALVKALVEAQHGRIRLDSAPGHGTRVTVTMPAQGSGHGLGRVPGRGDG